MKINRSASQLSGLVALTSMLAIALTGCSGSDGSDGAPGPAGPPGTSFVVSPTGATALNTTITGASVSSPPVVNFTVTNESGIPVVGLVDGNLRFNIAKLVPGTNGAPSNWQNYINRASSGAVQGTQERAAAGNFWGKLVDHRDGTYTYTFCTDITNNTGTANSGQCTTAPQPNICPAPCTDADGNALNISYQPTLTHRVSIQVTALSGTTLPRSNAVYDFVPAGGAVAVTRDIVTTGKCNECHNQLAAHGSRIETKLCTTCHNPGSWIAGTPSVTPNTPVDFKVMIHKIHLGEELPSVVAGTPYAIGTHDFSDVVFPQDIRNCTKCHDGTVTAQGDNWKNLPSKAACGACHDDAYFGAAPDPLKPYQTVSHATLSGIADPADNTCTLCHGAGKPQDVAVKHQLPNPGAKFKFNIVSVAGGNTPVIQISVVDPTNANAPYDIATDPAFTQVASGVSRIALVIGWSTTDFANNTSGVNPAQPISIFPTAECGGPTSASVPNSADWACSGPTAGVYTLTKLSALPAGATGTGRVGFEGHPAGLDTAVPPAYTVRVPVKSVVKDFAITGTLKARRTVVDIAKCDQCHAQLSLHGNNRTDEPQLCVICHNPNDTDAARRPKTGGILSGGVDGKLEESIDFKTMIHGIHGAGMREKGIVVYGFGSSVNDFSGVRFPGILNDCTTCHARTGNATSPWSFELTGVWESPTENGILANTISTTPTAVDAGTYATQLATPDDDLNISPTAAVCSSCHDTAKEAQHMIYNGGVFSATQTDITNHTVLGGYETCSICHGPGTVADVKVVHGVK